MATAQSRDKATSTPETILANRITFWALIFSLIGTFLGLVVVLTGNVNTSRLIVHIAVLAFILLLIYFLRRGYSHPVRLLTVSYIWLQTAANLIIGAPGWPRASLIIPALIASVLLGRKGGIWTFVITLVADTVVFLLGTNTDLLATSPIPTGRDFITDMIVLCFIAVIVDLPLRYVNQYQLNASQYHRMLGSIADWVIVVDRKGFYKRVFSKADDKATIKPEKLIGKNIAGVFSDSEATRLMGLVDSVLKTKGSVYTEYSLQDNDLVRCYEAHLSYLTSTEVVWVVRDVSDEVAAKREVQWRNKELALVADIADAISETDESNQLLQQVTALICKAFDGTSAYCGLIDVEQEQLCVVGEYYSADATENEQISDLNGVYKLDSDFEIMLHAMRTNTRVVATRGEETAPIPYPHLTQFDGKSCILTLITHDKGQIGFMEIWDSRVDRVFSKQEFELLEAANRHVSIAMARAALTNELGKNQAYYRAIIDGARDIYICRINAKNRKVLYANDAFCNYIEVPWEQLAKQDLLEHLSPKYTQHLDPIISRIHESSGPVTTILNHQDGRIIRWTGSPIHDANGQMVEIQASGVDITDVQKAQEKERQLLNLKTRFIEMASHEFRTPLAIIQSTSDNLKRYRSKLDDEGINQRHDKISVQIQHMTAMLNEVLTLGKLDAGTYNFKPEDLNLSEMVPSVIDTWKAAREITHDIQFVVDSPSTPVSVNGDARLIEQIVTNLVSNAVKYSPDGQTVAVTLTQNPENITLTCQDYGIGIPDKDQKYLFDAFVRANNVGGIEGTGLGMAIIKRAVEMHDGTITFTSKEGVGTTFTITLPVGL